MRRIFCRTAGLFVSLSLLTGYSVSSAQAQMCVHYARQLTDFNIHGDAWTWWQGAVGHYQRSNRPEVGAVLVFRRTPQLHAGHVSVVSEIVDRRTIRVDHSWFGGEGLYRGMKVVDTSPNNDWSSVRMLYEPSDSPGNSNYPTFGFIHPHSPSSTPMGRDQRLTVAANRSEHDADDADATMAMRGERSGDMRGERSGDMHGPRSWSAHHNDQDQAESTPMRLAAAEPRVEQAEPRAAEPRGRVANKAAAKRMDADDKPVSVAFYPHHKPHNGPTVQLAAATHTPHAAPSHIQVAAVAAPSGHAVKGHLETSGTLVMAYMPHIKPSIAPPHFAAAPGRHGPAAEHAALPPSLPHRKPEFAKMPTGHRHGIDTAQLPPTAPGRSSVGSNHANVTQVAELPVLGRNREGGASE